MCWYRRLSHVVIETVPLRGSLLESSISLRMRCYLRLSHITKGMVPLRESIPGSVLSIIDVLVSAALAYILRDSSVESE
jgi:hypothetical protein